MATPKTVIDQAKRETKKLSKQLGKQKHTLVSPLTLDLALALCESIQADKLQAKRQKDNLKNTRNWPFPKHFDVHPLS